MGNCCTKNDILEISKISEQSKTSELSVDEILELSGVDENIFKKIKEDTFGDIKTNIIIN